MNKIFLLMLPIILLSFLSSCDSKKLVDDYPQLKNQKLIIKETNVDKIIDIIEKEEKGLVIMGFPGCPWCQAIMPVLNDVASKEGLDVVYYLNIKNMRDDENDKNHPKYLKLKEYLKDSLDQEKDRINAPTTYCFVDGKMIDFHVDTVLSHQMIDGILPPLSVEQKKELETILTKMVKLVINN